MIELFQHGKIDNQIANGDSHARFSLFWLKDTERKILDGKMRIGWDFDETTQRRTHQLDLTTKHTKATKKIQNHLQRTSCPSCPSWWIREAPARANRRAARRSCNCRTTRRISGDTAGVRCRSSSRATRKNPG